ncbi:MAG: imelysin family protein [Bacteroidota bacterium]
MKYLHKISLTYLSIVLLACSGNNTSTPSNDFQVKNLVSDLTNQHIIANATAFFNQTSTLEQEINNYVSNPTVAKLEAAQSAWKQAAIAYGKVYTFNIGLIRDKFMHQALYNWPTVTNAIENFIAKPKEITAEYVQKLSPQAKTLSALEYLLFKSDTATVNTQFTDSENRRNYLKYVAKELKSRAERLVNMWNVSGENYKTTFIENTATGIKASFSLLYNGLHNLIDTGKVTKIGKPAGLENSQNTNPEIAQAHLSQTSLAILKSNIESIEAVYFNAQGLGISDYVSHIATNEKLNTAVQAKINEIYAAIDALPGSLFSAITQNPTAVQTLHEKLNDLRILFSVDIRSILSITITSTDNDGD